MGRHVAGGTGDVAPTLAKLDVQGGLMATDEYVTHEELAVALAGVATKEDLERFATKEDLERFATKEDLEQLEERMEAKFATKQDLRNIDDKLEARFSGLYALIRDYLLNDAQRDDWDHRNGS